MPLHLIAYLPDGPAVEHLLDSPAVIGRDAGCQLVLAHASVSRRHAELVPSGAGGRWRLRDLDSKNGSFVEGRPVRDTELPESAWIRIGDVVCELQRVDASTADRLAGRPRQRRLLSSLHLDRIAAAAELPALLQSTVAAVVELAGCERGQLLLPEHDQLLLWSAEGLRPVGAEGLGFDGSRGLLQRALDLRSAVVVNDVSSHPLGAQASVVAGGLRCLVCLPICSGGEVLALVYADSRRPGAPITGDDLELLEALIERAAIWIEARRGSARLAGHARSLAEAVRGIASP